jgi:predicted transcriptional regulator
MLDSHIIIDKFGGTAETSRLLGVSMAAVSNWKKRQRIPLSHVAKFLKEAEKRAILLTFEDFVQ